MKSKTWSSEQVRTPNPWFNRGLLVKNLSRFWPLWALYAAIWVVCMPASQFLMLFGRHYRGGDPADMALRTQQETLSQAGSAALAMSLVFGCLFAMALFSYLYSSRSVGMMHSFPIRREGLFLTQYVTGLGVFLVIDVVVLVLTAAVQGAAGCLSWSALGTWFACAAGEMLFFYSFAVFCAMFTGQLLALPVFYGILNGLVYGVALLLQSLGSLLYYGYYSGSVPSVVEWFSPVVKLAGVSYTTYYSELNEISGYHMENMTNLIPYLAAAVVLTVLALLLYRTHRSESAGDVISVKWAKYLFRYGVAVCCALSLGQGVYSILWNQFGDNSSNSSIPLLGVCMVVLGLVGYFVAEMLMCKSFRVLRTGWRGAAVLTAALAVLCVCAAADVLGVENRVPEVDTVESVSFGIGGQNYCSGTVSDPEVIQQLTQLHRSILDNKETQLSRQQTYWADDPMLVKNVDDVSDGSAYLSLNYCLKNGARVKRSYDLIYLYSELDDPDSVISQLAALVKDPRIQRVNLLSQLDDDMTVTGGNLEEYSATGTYVGFTEAGSMDAATAKKLFDAIMQDVDAGHFGADQFGPDAGKNTYANTLDLYCTDSTGRRSDDIYLQFNTRCSYLLQVLADTGLADRVALVTYGQMGSDSEQMNGIVETTDADPTTIIGGADSAADVWVEDYAVEGVK